MFTAYMIVTVLTIAANAGMAVADFAHVKYVLANSAEVGTPRSWIPALGALKAAGAVGLLLGIAGMDLIGIAAAIGLVLFFTGAVAVHIRARVFHTIAFPCGFLALAVASLALALAD